MNRSLMAVLAAPFALAACTAQIAGGPDVDRPDVDRPEVDRGMAHGNTPGLCDAAQVQSMIGQRATETTGARLLQITGARQLRWVPPRTAVTMDYREDRLTVSYDDNMIMERISCG